MDRPGAVVGLNVLVFWFCHVAELILSVFRHIPHSSSDVDISPRFRVAQLVKVALSFAQTPKEDCLGLHLLLPPPGIMILPSRASWFVASVLL